MTDEEYKRLRAIQNAIAEQERVFAAKAAAAEDRFAPVEKAIADLLVAVKKRIADRDGGQSSLR